MATFVQIGDTHLGKHLHRVRLIDDQRALLDQVIRILEEIRPDALLITGDVYDVPSPPEYAVSLLDDFLTRIIHDLKIRTVVIPGNHDAAVRLSFGARAFREELHIAGPLTGTVEPVTLTDEHGPIHIYPVPFLKPSRVREVTGDEGVRDQQSAMNRVVQDIQDAGLSDRSVLMAHTFVSGGSVTDSEQEIGAVGGVETVDHTTFDPFHYVAVGHLHRPQHVGNERVQYAGSLMKYSLSEVDHHKSITVVDMDADGEIDVRRVPLVPPRDLRRVEGTLAELVARGTQGNPEDYVVATLLDKGPVLYAMDRLREIYPNAIHVERPQWEMASSIKLPNRDHTQVSMRELFGAFFEEVTDGALSDEETAALDEVLQSVKDAS